jgi:AraC-like DNA-binding protein
MISFEQYVPTKVAQWVKSIWYMEVGDALPLYEEEIIPDGHHELILYLNGRGRRRQVAGGAWVDQPGVFIASQTLQSYRLRMPAGAKLYGVRFYPHSFYALVGVPLHLLAPGVPPVEDLLTGHGLDACIDEDRAGSFRRLEARLVALLAGRTIDSPGYAYVDYSVRQLAATHGTVSIGRLVEKSGVTPKHYDELFKKYVGIPPKCLSSILQFNRFIDYRTRFPEKTLTECGYEAGYYDQSHLIKTFSQWVGATPGQYFAARSVISDLFAGL